MCTHTVVLEIPIYSNGEWGLRDESLDQPYLIGRLDVSTIDPEIMNQDLSPAQSIKIGPCHYVMYIGEQISYIQEDHETYQSRDLL